MKPRINTKLLSIVSLLNLIPISIVLGQWHFPSHFEPQLQQPQPSIQVKNHIKKAPYLNPLIIPTTPAPPPPAPPPSPNKRAAILSPPNQIILYPPPPANPPAPAPPRCGESLNATNSGISYSPFAPVLEQERCVWTVVVPGASGYEIDALYIGFDPKDNNKNGISNHVLVHGFKRGFKSTEISITGKGIIKIIDASILVITFITGLNPGNATQGFILKYAALTIGTVLPVSAQSLHQFVLPETSVLTHPATPNTFYQNNELSSFIFLPVNNTHVADQKRSLVYIKVGLEIAKCEDYVDVYGLNVTSTVGAGLLGNYAKWDHKGRICGYLTTQLIDHTDLLMLIFMTDAKGQDSGFQITYTTC